MAKIIFTIEDKTDEKGKDFVQVICTPSVEELLKKIYNTIEGGTMAEGYTVTVLNALKELDKKMAAKHGHQLLVPKIVV